VTRDEFVTIALHCGYASRKTAKKYAESKGSLDESDLIEVWRVNERGLDVKNRRVERSKYRNYEGAKTTKRLKQSDLYGSDRV